MDLHYPSAHARRAAWFAEIDKEIEDCRDLANRYSKLFATKPISPERLRECMEIHMTLIGAAGRMAAMKAEILARDPLVEIPSEIEA